MAINRTGKSIPTEKNRAADPSSRLNNLLEADEEKPRLSNTEIDRGKQDIEAVNNDLALLSTLLGRPISIADLPSLAGGGTQVRTATPTRATTTTSTTTTTTEKPDILKEVELLQSLLQTQAAINPNPELSDSDYYGKTDEAILATILKQQGIGPSHNNIPVVSVDQCTLATALVHTHKHCPLHFRRLFTKQHKKLDVD